MIVKLPFGADSQPVDLRGLRVRPLEPCGPRAAGEVGALVAGALDRPIEEPSLFELCQGRRRVTVVVPDSTRKTALPQVLPSLLERVLGTGVPAEGVTVLVACGTHPAADEEAIRALVGPLPPGVCLVQHDSRDPLALAEVGVLASGVPVRLHRAAAEADVLVTVGIVQHHYFAGFGGGPKMVFPGVAGYEEIQANHGRVLLKQDGELRRDPRCEPGRLEGNPLAEEIMEAAALCPPHLSLCFVRGRPDGFAWAGAGPWRRAFAEAVDRERQWFTAAAGPFAMVVASGGGAPSDESLIQAHKGMDAACRFLEPGGELLFVASLAAGAGSPDMAPFLADPDPAAILESLSRRYVQYGHTTLRILEKTSRYRIHLASDFDPALAESLGMHPVADPAEITARWRAEHPGQPVGVMPGAAVYP